MHELVVPGSGNFCFETRKPLQFRSAAMKTYNETSLVRTGVKRSYFSFFFSFPICLILPAAICPWD
jgi:hypothetical protein